MTTTKTPGLRLLVKYGGNAMIDPTVQHAVLRELVDLRARGHEIVLVHGGGPAIAQLLDEVGHESEFVGGHRRTTAEAMVYVQMALRGRVNVELVQALGDLGQDAVGLSGVDARMVRATRRRHVDESGKTVDLGFVGDVDTIETRLLDQLLESGVVPVLAPLALGPDGAVHNVNADAFAGHLAAALEADLFVVLTDVDGLRRDPADPDTVMRRVSAAEIESLRGTSIRGGMIPKIDACLTAIEGGVRRAQIVDGTTPGGLVAAVEADPHRGTEIHR